MQGYNITEYPDGATYPSVNEFRSGFTYRINSYKDLWILKQLMDTYEHNNVWPTITIPFLIDAQADRRFSYNQPANLKLVCDFLNGMKASFKVFHPHNPEVVESIMDNVEIINNLSFISEVINDINSESLILMSSDAGGFKPLMKLCDELRWTGGTYSATKSRKYVDGKSLLIQEIGRDNFEGKDILIVDDLCIFGGTFKGLSKMLQERNCGKLYLAVSHITVQDLKEDPVTEYFNMVYTTNSKFDKYYSNGDAISEDKLSIIKRFY